MAELFSQPAFLSGCSQVLKARPLLYFTAGNGASALGELGVEVKLEGRKILRENGKETFVLAYKTRH